MTLISGLGHCVVERVDSEEYELGLAYSEKPPADKEWTGTRQKAQNEPIANCVKCFRTP